MQGSGREGEAKQPIELSNERGAALKETSVDSTRRLPAQKESSSRPHEQRSKRRGGIFPQSNGVKDPRGQLHSISDILIFTQALSLYFPPNLAWGYALTVPYFSPTFC